MSLNNVQFTRDARQVANYGRDKSTGTHGSVFSPGQTEVLPANSLDRDPLYTETRPDKAYYTSHKYDQPEVAQASGWNWARNAEQMQKVDGEPLGRQVVHEVVPSAGSTVDQDPHTKEWSTPGQASLVSDKGLNITDTHWIPPVPKDSVGVQGTLPNMNWNQFGGEGQQNWTNL